MIDKLKQLNRGLLELVMGIFFLGGICLIIGCCLVKDPVSYGAALLAGVVLAGITAYHMYRTLDRALNPGMDASRMISTAGLIRYFCILIVLCLIWYIGLNPLFTFLGVMTLKGAAYMQPLTHKVCNWMFHEVDPIPQPMEEDTFSSEEIVDK